MQVKEEMKNIQQEEAPRQSRLSNENGTNDLFTGQNSRMKAIERSTET
jgi:hypothetical protein